MEEVIENGAALPLVVITGPTASGKTSLAIKLAKKYDGEIICADSRTIYKCMDIGTAKPTAEEQSEVTHWGIDLVAPGQRFTVVDFQSYAIDKIQEIRNKGKVPFLVGGTGLYIESVVLDYKFPPVLELEKRAVLESRSVEELKEYCLNNNIFLPENHKNKRHLINAILRKNVAGTKRDNPIDNCIVVVISTDKQTLRRRIAARANTIFSADIIRETRYLGQKFGWTGEAMTGNIYPLIRQYIQGDISQEEAKEKFINLDCQLAKRQTTWFKKMLYARHLSLEDSYIYLSNLLDNRPNMLL